MLHQSIRLCAATCAFMLATVHAVADDTTTTEGTADKAGTIHAYVGGNLVWGTHSETAEFNGRELSADVSIQGVYARLGMEFNEYLSGELRLGAGSGKDTVSVRNFLFRADVEVTAEVNHFLGGYLRAGAPSGTMLFPYVMVGLTHGKMTAEARGISISDTDSGLSFGVGLDWNFHKNFYVNVEYTSYLDKDGVEISGFSIGLARKDLISTGR